MSTQGVGPSPGGWSARRWLADAARVDEAVYAAVARTPTPALDVRLGQLSRVADRSKLWMGTAAVLALVGGRRGRLAAAQGLLCVAVNSAAVNVLVKPVGRRHRPDRSAAEVPELRHVRMPHSRSFPSGHSASAFAFAFGVGHRLPVMGIPLHALAGAVAYSRVHTGVHFPGDVVVGSMLGTALAQVTTGITDRYLADRHRLGRSGCPPGPGAAG